MAYLAVIVDLIKSREIPDCENEQARIEAVFADINLRFSEIIVSRLTLTLGDEFQVLLRIDSDAVRLLDDLEVWLDLPCRIGIGYGGILTKINPDISIGADGPAFWQARAAIDEIHQNDWGGNATVQFMGLSDGQDQTINALFRTTDTIKKGWTRAQRDTFAKMLEQGIYRSSFDQKSFAETIGISQSSLSKRLSGGAIKIYLDARLTIGDLLEEWCESSNES